MSEAFRKGGELASAGRTNSYSACHKDGNQTHLPQQQRHLTTNAPTLRKLINIAVRRLINVDK